MVAVDAAREVHRGRQDRGAQAHGQRRRARRQGGALAEELDLDAATLQVTVGQETHDVVVTQRPHHRRCRLRGPAAPRSCRAPIAARRTTRTAPGGSSFSTTTVIWCPWSAIHRPAHSQPPRCGSTRITPLPTARAVRDVLVALDAPPSLDGLGREVRQPKALEPVVRVGVECLLHGATQTQPGERRIDATEMTRDHLRRSRLAKFAPNPNGVVSPAATGAGIHRAAAAPKR